MMPLKVTRSNYLQNHFLRNKSLSKRLLPRCLTICWLTQKHEKADWGRRNDVSIVSKERRKQAGLYFSFFLFFEAEPAAGRSSQIRAQTCARAAFFFFFFLSQDDTVALSSKPSGWNFLMFESRHRAGRGGGDTHRNPGEKNC